MFPFVYPMKAHMDVSSKFNKRTFLPIGIWSCKLFTHCHMTYAWQHKCQRRRARAWTSTQTPPSTHTHMLGITFWSLKAGGFLTPANGCKNLRFWVLELWERGGGQCRPLWGTIWAPGNSKSRFLSEGSRFLGVRPQPLGGPSVGPSGSWR